MIGRLKIDSILIELEDLLLMLPSKSNYKLEEAQASLVELGRLCALPSRYLLLEGFHIVFWQECKPRTLLCDLTTVTWLSL